MIICVACQCGSSDKLIRSRLELAKYKDFLSIPVNKGKAKTESALNSIPQLPEVDMLRSHLSSVSKYAVVLGYDDEGNCRWVDLSHGQGFKNDVDLSLLVEHFA